MLNVQKLTVCPVQIDPDLEDYRLNYQSIALAFALECIECSRSKFLGNTRDPYNCYAYARQENPTTEGFIQDPGSTNGPTHAANITKEELQSSVLSDGAQVFEWPKDRELPNLYGSGGTLVASFIYSFVDHDLGIQPYWHFMRQGPFGLWYEKQGMLGEVRQSANSSGEKIFDPREEKDFCALYIFPRP